MAISWINFGTVAEASTGNLAPGIPASMQAGDLMLMFAYGADQSTLSAPSGWTSGYGALISNATDTTNSQMFYLWRRWWQSGDSAPTLTRGGTADCASAVIMGFRGVDPTNPIEDSDYLANGAGTSPSYNSMTSTTLNTMVVLMGGLHDNHAWGAITSTPTLSWTEQFDDDNTSGNDCQITASTAPWSSSGNLTGISQASGNDPSYCVGVILRDATISINISDKFQKSPDALD